jgi:glycosyltransferase involved in cell wall biosynthesis
MIIGFNITPLKTGHKTRGVGAYTRNLLEELKKREDIEVREFQDIKTVEGVDAIYYPWFDLFFRTLVLRKNIPAVVTVHDVMPLIYPKNYPLGLRGKINLFWQTRALRSCQQIITVSKASKQDLIKLLKIKEDKITVIGEGVSSEFKLLPDAKLFSVKRKYNLPDHFLLYVGDANFVKNLPFLIEGFKRIKEDVDFKDLKLVLVGGVFLKKVDDIEHPELVSLKQVFKLIKDYSLENDVYKPGQLAEGDLISFYNLATIYVQPSLYEGFGLPVLEAMSCGLPVVSSKAGSLMEVGGDAAVYFDPTNLQQFVTTLKEVLRDKSLQNKLSKMGLKRAQQFTWEKVTDEVIKIYGKAIT